MDLPTINVLSICSGAGGLDLAVKLAMPNARVICYVEREAYACELLATRMQQNALDDAPNWSDLTTCDGKPWRGIVDCIIAGIPCQPHSVAGRRLGANDERNLWPVLARIIGKAQPSCVFLENVAGATGFFLSTVVPELERMGYRVAAGLFSASEVGFEFTGERFFALAIDASKSVHFNAWSMLGKGEEWETQRKPRGLLGPYSFEEWRKYRTWDERLPKLCGLDHGHSNRVDRLRLCGNGVVPLQAAYAFISLAATLIN